MEEFMELVEKTPFGMWNVKKTRTRGDGDADDLSRNNDRDHFNL